jgi:8-oxo-dGTP diphosphatase
VTAVQNAKRLLDGITPLDDLERRHLDDAQAWLSATSDVFRRTASPVAPSKHLVSYFLLVDADDGAFLLGDHRKSGLWLPSGGHVEPGEDPVETVRRECVEELGVEANFDKRTGEQPLFITVTETRSSPPDQHTDVSLWFVLAHSRDETLRPDPREYRSVRWWTIDEFRNADPEGFDPHQGRLLDKLQEIGPGSSGHVHSRSS